MQYLAALAALLPLVAGHGFVLDPPARRPGEAYKAACGEQPFYQQSSDINGNVQGIFQVIPKDFDPAKCNLWLCKGFLLEDNPDKLQSFTPGQKIDFTVNVAAPHTGYANVSVVKTSSNSIIGAPLIEFTNYASNAGMAKNNTAFSVTLPSSLGGACTSAGECVLQWFWDAPDIDQTYESCVDFVVSGLGSGGNGGSSPTTTRAAATTAVASTRSVDAVTAGETTAAASEIVSTPAGTSAASTPSATPGNGTDEGDEDGDEEDCSDDGEEEEGDDDGTEEGDDECPAEGDDGDEDEGEDGDEEDCSEDDQGEYDGDDDSQDSDSSSTSVAGPSPTSVAAQAQALKPTAVPTSFITVAAKPRFTAKPSAYRQ